MLKFEGVIFKCVACFNYRIRWGYYYALYMDHVPGKLLSSVAFNFFNASGDNQLENGNFECRKPFMCNFLFAALNINVSSGKC